VTWAPLQNMQTKKVSDPTFLHQIKRCFGILFGLSQTQAVKNETM
jgi:hypothetical protein